MNILFLSKEYPPETGWGGIGTYVYNIAHALSDKGHSVHVITLSYDRRDADPYKQVLRPVATLSDRRDARPIYDRQGDYSAHNGNIHVHRIRPLRFPTPVLNNFLFKSLEILKFNIAVILKIWEIVKKEKIDIIEAPEWRSEAFLLSFLKPGRIPLVIKCHSPSILLNEIYNPPIPPLNKGGDRRIDSRFVEWMEKITCLSEMRCIKNPATREPLTTAMANATTTAFRKGRWR